MKNYSAEFLLGLLEGVEIPDDSSVDDVWEKEFDCRDGWRVVVFYDVGELDYIEYFVTPDGEKINFWDWPESNDRSELMNWRGHE